MSDTVNVEWLRDLGALPSEAQTLRSEVRVGVSGRHIHVCQEHVDILFGKGYDLRPARDLTQPGQYACQETLVLRSVKGEIPNVRILGPVRPETQIELSLTDTFRLKLEMPVPVRMSGDIVGSPGVTLIGPSGEITVDRGVIISQRHVHMTPEFAREFGYYDKQIVAVLCPGARQVVFGNVIVRVRADFDLDFHIDTDEANAAGINSGAIGYIL
jgi:putative phosphotransacetylase